MKHPVITRIVLLGGGYVTVWAYRSLVKSLRKQIDCGQVLITVVCPNEYHAFHGWTAESLTDIIQEQNRMSPLSEILSRAHIIKGKAVKIIAADNTVFIRNSNGSSQLIQYDHLLLGMGSFDSEDVEGLKEYGYQVKSDEAFSRTKQTMKSLVKQAALAPPDIAKKLLTFTIAGGGFTGVELATNIAEYINILRNQHRDLQKIKPVIQLINSGPTILNVLQSKFQRIIRYTQKILQQYNIEVINNNKIKEVTDEGAFLCDRYIHSSMVISTIGQSRMVLKGTENMQRDNLKRIYTNEYLQINDSNIWGGGDICHVAHYKTGEACPSNALWAIKHGEYVGRNIALFIKGQPLKAFDYRGLGQCASLGIGKGIGELYGLQFTGWVAWIMRWFFFNYFMPSRNVMFNAVGDWMFLLFRRKRKGLYTEKNKINSKYLQTVGRLHQPV
jgi:NADH dehydrogenase